MLYNSEGIDWVFHLFGISYVFFSQKRSKESFVFLVVEKSIWGTLVVLEREDSLWCPYYIPSNLTLKSIGYKEQNRDYD